MSLVSLEMSRFRSLFILTFDLCCYILYETLIIVQSETMNYGKKR